MVPLAAAAAVALAAKVMLLAAALAPLGLPLAAALMTFTQNHPTEPMA